MSRPQLAGVAVVVALLVGWSVQSFVVDDGAATPPTAAPIDADATAGDAHSVVVPVAAGDVEGVPVGYPQTRSGAATAAVNWVASFPRLMRMNPLTLQTTLRELMSTAGAADGVDEALEDYFELYDELGPEFQQRVWIESPLQTTVTAWSPQAASIGVWSVVVTGDEEEDSAVVALWRTHRIEMVWQRDDWKVEAVVVVEGPTAVTAELALPSDPAEFAEVDAWQPAVFADTTPDEEE